MEANGTLQQQQAIYMDSTQAHLRGMKASAEDVYDSFLDADTIKTVADGLSNILTLFARLLDSIGGGKTVLMGLGAIGVSVFSKQISNGINTFITNMEIAKQRTNEVRQALKNLEDVKNLGGLDKDTQSLINSKSQIMNLSEYMNPDSYHQMQQNYQNLTNQYNAKAEYERKAQNVNAYASMAGVSSPDLLNAEGNIDNIAVPVNNVLDRINEIIREKGPEINDTYVSCILEANVKDTKRDNELILTGTSEMLDKLKLLYTENPLDKNNLMTTDQRIDFQALEEEYRQVEEMQKKGLLDTPEAEERLNLLNKNIRNFYLNVKQGAEEAGQTLSDIALNTEKSILNGYAVSKEEIDRLNNEELERLRTTAQHQQIDSITKMTGAVMSLGVAMGTLSNIGTI